MVMVVVVVVENTTTTTNNNPTRGIDKLNDEEARRVVQRYLLQKTKLNTDAAEEKRLEKQLLQDQEEDEEGQPSTNKKPSSRFSCSCRKSACILLYCPCFGDGLACSHDCKCKNCKNPKGANPIVSQQMQIEKVLEENKKKAKAAKKKRRADQEKERSDQLLVKEAALTSKKEEFPSLLMLTVSPGRLGLTLAILPNKGGAQIKHVDPACTFRSQVEVGDCIVTIDGKKVVTLEDAMVGKERVRKFGIVKQQKKMENSAVVGGGRKEAGAASAVPIAGKPVASATAATVFPTAPALNAYGPPNLRDPTKLTFPYLAEIKANGTDRHSEHRREDVLTEALQWDKKNLINTQVKMGPSRYQLLCIPLKRRDTVNKRELDNQCFHQYNKQTKVFDKFLNAWASYCDGSQEDAANMILFYMAKRFPQCYVQNFDMATKKHEKMTGGGGPPPVELPPNFVTYDGTNDIKWNTRYSELVKYRQENGDCKVYSKSELGRWVCSQRSARVNKAKNLNAKRVELLDNLGFLWSGLPEGWARPVPGGDPRQNRAIAARLVYPDLTIREVLQLGGFGEEELNAVKDIKHTWRTGYVYYKDLIMKKVDNYETARRSGARVQIEQLVTILRGEDEDRFEQVFGGYGSLLPDFLEAAEERRRNGTVEKPRSRSAKKRNRNEDVVVETMSDDDEQQQLQQEPARKQSHVEDYVAEQEADAVDFQAQVPYDQQVARDLHSWRQQSHYWR
mmetsp:Transcript_26209/g.56261  ORF Transcript_26209/g.56261 Transcript_26209/m.56261 type:complete len:733 (+) Transcript_26209:449-2647(+)